MASHACTDSWTLVNCNLLKSIADKTKEETFRMEDIKAIEWGVTKCQSADLGGFQHFGWQCVCVCEF